MPCTSESVESYEAPRVFSCDMRNLRMQAQQQWRLEEGRGMRTGELTRR